MRIATIAAFVVGAAVTAAAVLALRPAALEPGLDRPAVEGVVADYLKSNPRAVIDAIHAYRAQEEATQIERQRQQVLERWDELTRSSNDPVLGNPDGDVTLVEFFDYRCGYCRKVFDDVMALIEQDGQVRVVLKEFPILGPESLIAARASLASLAQGPERYAAFHRALMEAGADYSYEGVMRIAASVGLDATRLAIDMNASEVAATIQANHALAEALGIRGTPAFLTREQIIPGAVDKDTLQKIVDEARAAKSG